MSTTVTAIEQELAKLKDELSKKVSSETEQLEFIKSFNEQIFKFDKGNKKGHKNPHVHRKQIIWVDFGINIGQELNNPHPAVVLYAEEGRGTVVVVPLTTKEDTTSSFVVEIGQIDGMEKEYSHVKIDQIRAISRLRIIVKKNKTDNNWYFNYNNTDKKYNNPKLSPEQLQKIDDKIAKFSTESK